MWFTQITSNSPDPNIIIAQMFTSALCSRSHTYNNILASAQKNFAGHTNVLLSSSTWDTSPYTSHGWVCRGAASDTDMLSVWRVAFSVSMEKNECRVYVLAFYEFFSSWILPFHGIKLQWNILSFLLLSQFFCCLMGDDNLPQLPVIGLKVLTILSAFTLLMNQTMFLFDQWSR